MPPKEEEEEAMCIRDPGPITHAQAQAIACAITSLMLRKSLFAVALHDGYNRAHFPRSSRTRRRTVHSCFRHACASTHPSHGLVEPLQLILLCFYNLYLMTFFGIIIIIFMYFVDVTLDSGKVVVPLSKINPKHANKSIVGKQGVEPKGISFI